MSYWRSVPLLLQLSGSAPTPSPCLSPPADCLTLPARSGTFCMLYSQPVLSNLCSSCAWPVACSFPCVLPMSRRSRSVGGTARPKAASTSFRGDLSAMEDEDTEHLLRSSSQERPLAKAKAGRPAGPPPPTAANLPSSVGDAAAAVGRETESSSGGGSGCGGLSTVGPAGPPAPTPATSVAPATPLRTCLDLPPTPFPTRASFRQALRGTLPPLFVELNVWRQHRLPRLRCLMQVRPFNFRRRLLACNTTSA